MSFYQDITHQLQTVYPPGEASALVRLIMEERFGLSQTDLLLGKDSNLSANDREVLQNIVARLLKNEPIQYILGETEFCGLRLKVAPGVLIPRPETAELVEWIESSQHAPVTISEGQKAESERRQLSLLDIGTGSGCIALALASRGFKVEAWDVSDEALSIARDNATRLGLNVAFRKQDILDNSLLQNRCTLSEDNTSISPTLYDVIVSNPPYICHREKKEMEANVLDYEPHLALFVPDDDPLLFYRAIARFATVALRPSGYLYFEINRAYSEETKQMLLSLGFQDVKIRHDQFDNPRMIRARWGV